MNEELDLRYKFIMLYQIARYFIISAALIYPTLVWAGEPVVDVYVPSGMVVKGNYYAIGNTVEIVGSIESDLIVAGYNVIVTGAVGGDVIAVGGNVRITGPVAGNIRVLGGHVDIYGPVSRNVLVGSGTLLVADSAEVAGHITAMAGNLEIRGQVAGSVLATAGTAIIAGRISGPVKLFLDKNGNVEIRETAVLENEFIYYAAQPAHVVEGAKLAQEPQYHEFINRRPELVWWWRFLISLFGAWVIAMILSSLAPRKFREAMEEGMIRPWVSLGWGIVWFIVVPLIIIILLFTVIGLPLAIALLSIYILNLILAPVVAGGAWGWYLKNRLTEGWLSRQSMLLVILLGLLIYRLVILIPVVGAVVALVGGMWGLGAIVLVQTRLLKSFQ